MRMLADNPSMDFLRQEAKDLLDVLRDAEAGTTLSDAQRATAEEYGYRTWSDLKAEVDRRRADLPQAPAGLAEEIAAAYGLGAVVDVAPIRYEYMGRRWDLRTDHGRFVVRPVFDWIGDEQSAIAVDLQERARAAGVLSPVPVRTAAGGFVHRALDQSWRVEHWMDLGPVPVQPLSPAVAQQLGAALAAVHEVAPPTDRPIEGPWVSPSTRPTPEVWEALLARGRAAEQPWVDELVRLSPMITELCAVTAEVPEGGVVISNCDLGSGLRLGEGGELVALHWDFSGPMVPSWELASTLHGSTQQGSNLEAARALMAGYRTRRPEAAALTLQDFSSTITGWCTWLLHRAWEAADPEPSEQRDFAGRTLREVLDAPVSVASIEALLAAVA